MSENLNYTKNQKGLKIFAVFMVVMFIISASVSGLLINYTRNLLNENQSNSLMAEQAAVSNSANSSNGSNLTNAALTVQQSSDGSDALTVSKVIEKMKPSVVCIEIEVQVSNYYGGFFGRGSGGTYTQQGSGSGFILTSDGYIATNYHVIEQASTISVTLNSGEKYDATVVGYDADADLAVIKINAKNLTVAELGSSDAAAEGEFVVAIGCPGGAEFAGSSTFGIISAINREIQVSDTKNMTVIQTDASINPGNSGGPLVDMNGKVIGINTMKLADSGYEGMGFAIPISSAKTIFNNIMANPNKSNSQNSANNSRNSNNSNNANTGSAVSFGITGATVTADEAAQKNIPQGFKIAAIASNSPFANSGIQTSDIITALDGKTVTSYEDLVSLKKNYKSGDSITITIFRNGDSFNFTVKLK